MIHKGVALVTFLMFNLKLVTECLDPNLEIFESEFEIEVDWHKIPAIHSNA